MTASFIASAHDRGLRSGPCADAPWAWCLPAGQAHTLAADAAPRWLAVCAGEVWLTEARADRPAEDLWLTAGQRHRLPAGTRWVVQGWPRATLELLQAPPGAPFAPARAAAR